MTLAREDHERRERRRVDAREVAARPQIGERGLGVDPRTRARIEDLEEPQERPESVQGEQLPDAPWNIVRARGLDPLPSHAESIHPLIGRHSRGG